MPYQIGISVEVSLIIWYETRPGNPGFYQKDFAATWEACSQEYAFEAVFEKGNEKIAQVCFLKEMFVLVKFARSGNCPL